jgi:hypothetical protein
MEGHSQFLNQLRARAGKGRLAMICNYRLIKLVEDTLTDGPPTRAGGRDLACCARLFSNTKCEYQAHESPHSPRNIQGTCMANELK